jgi:hypothetical protein
MNQTGLAVASSENRSSTAAAEALERPGRAVTFS